MASVSIIIPLHNRAAELPQTLDSLLAQTRGDWEAIVVDDHSSDGADRVARAYAAREPRITVHALPDPKRGAPAARNFGLARSNAELVIFLDADDLLAPTCVEHRVAHMAAHADLDLAIWRVGLFREQPGDVPFLWNADTGEDDLDRLLKMDVPWGTAGPIWRRSSLLRLALEPAATEPQVWDESVLSGQDWEFHIRAVATGLRYARVDEVDAHWRMAGPARESIGKASFGAEHARARPAIIRRMYAFIDKRGLLTDTRRRAFAAMYFGAADNLARTASRREARAVWQEAKQLGLLSRKQHAQVDRYLLALRWPPLAERMRRRIDRSFPRDLLPRRGAFFNTAPADPSRAPAISIVMSAYNNVAYVEAAVRSILAQSFRDFEFIIIDDGSTDGTGEVLRRFAESDCRIRLVSRENKGLTVSLNEGLAMARGELIARMDADDIALKDRLAKQVAHLAAHPEVVALGTRIETIDPFGSPLERPQHHLDHAAIDAELIRGSGWALVHPTVIMRAAALKQLGGYREEWNNTEDLDLFLRLAEIGKVANLPDVLLQYRQHLGSVNHQKFERQMKIKRTILEQAHARRGTSLPTDWAFKDRREVEPVTQHLFWGWKAHKLGNLLAARRHAYQVLKRKPFNLGGLRLLAVAFRDERRRVRQDVIAAQAAKA
jgi:glycosyltransferase involved in cell wall biosynthesis